MLLAFALAACTTPPGRAACETYLDCVAAGDQQWRTLDAEEQYGARSSCWNAAGATEVCGQECYARTAELPEPVRELDACRLDAIDRSLLTSEAFLALHRARFCDAHNACNTFNQPCEAVFPELVCGPCPTGGNVFGRCFDVEGALACLDAPLTCNDDVPAGQEYVSLPPECEALCWY